MKNLFELKLEKDWVNKGDYNFEATKGVKIYAESFAEAYIQLTIYLRVSEDAHFLTLRNDTEVICTEKEIETESIIPVENIGENLENLFNIIHEILMSLYQFKAEKVCE